MKGYYILTTIFLAGLSIFSFTETLHLIKASTAIQRTIEVKEALHSISSSLVEAEAKKYKFLLSRDSSLLDNRDQALRAIQVQFDSLKQRLKDNPEQSENVMALDGLIRRKLQSLDDDLNEDVTLPSNATLKTNIHDGGQKMDSVRQYMDRMIAVETELYTLRSQTIFHLSKVTPIYIIVLFLGALLILLFSYFKINKDLRESQNLHATVLKQNHKMGNLGKAVQETNEALAFQNQEKESRAAELMIANKELAFQSEEKEKRAAELVVANLELGFQNEVKEKLAAELIVANLELGFQNEEKEKRALELFNINKELQLFLNISSHDLQEPLRKIQMSASRIEDSDFNALSLKGRDHFMKMQEAAHSMQVLIEDLLTYSRTSSEERIFEYIDLSLVVEEVTEKLKEVIDEKQAVIEITYHCEANIIPFQFRQLIHNMLSNALKFSIPGKPPHILISSCIKKGSDCANINLLPDQEYCHITIKDNGIGFEPEYSEKIFEVFQRLNAKEVYKGTGIGLAIVKKIVENHNGMLTATSQLNEGAAFDIYLPTKNIE